MFIHDDEMREIFRDEAEERLKNIEQGFLDLESTPDDVEIINYLFRECHSLKGAASMLGLEAIESMCHELESLMAQYRKDGSGISPAALSICFQVIDAVQLLYRWAVFDEPAQVDVKTLIAKMKASVGAAPGVAQEGGQKTEADDVEQGGVEEGFLAFASDQETHSQETQEPEFDIKADLQEVTPVHTEQDVPVDRPREEDKDGASKGGVRRNRTIETLRVSAAKLDKMVSYSGELVVTKNRFVHRVSEFQKLLSLWTEVERFLRYLWGRGNRNISREMLLSLQDKYQRKSQELGDALREMELGLRADCGNLNTLANAIEWGIRSTRLIPLSSVFDAMPRLVRDLSVDLKKRVDFRVEGGHTAADKRVIEEIKDPLMHMIRNAMDHGIETPQERKASGKPEVATLTLRAYQAGGRLIIEIEDDGRGLNTERIRKKAVERGIVTASTARSMNDRQVQYLIFSSGFSTTDVVTDISGRGVGMDVVKSNIEALKGTIDIESQVGRGTKFRMKFPLTLSTTRVLLAESGNLTFGIPVDSVVITSRIDSSDLFLLQGRDTVYLLERPIVVVHLHNLLEIEPNSQTDALGWRSASRDRKNCIVLRYREQELAILVDVLRNEQEVVLKPLSGPLRRVPNISGASTLEDGSICMILNPGDLVESVSRVHLDRLALGTPDEAMRNVRILLVEDSMTTRMHEKRMLEAAGYEVLCASDGQEGFEMLSKGRFDILISDVEMPRLDGLSLTRKVRTDLGMHDIPVILVTSLASEEDMRRGRDAGADAYLTKGRFDHRVLLETVRKFLLNPRQVQHKGQTHS